MARSAGAPGILRLLTLEVPRDKIADRGPEDVVVGNAEGSKEGELADQHRVLEAAGSRWLAGRDVEL